MKLEIDSKLKKVMPLDMTVATAVDKALLKITMDIQTNAKINAPYDTWTLRRSIWTDLSRIQKWIAVVWSDVVYSRRREYENHLNPWRKFYLKRAYEENKDKILKEMINAIHIALW